MFSVIGVLLFGGEWGGVGWGWGGVSGVDWTVLGFVAARLREVLCGWD